MNDAPTREQVQEALDLWDQIRQVFTTASGIPGSQFIVVLAEAARAWVEVTDDE
jgi:hypothetical protein